MEDYDYDFDRDKYIFGASIGAAFGLAIMGCLIFHCSSLGVGQSCWGVKGSTLTFGNNNYRPNRYKPAHTSSLSPGGNRGGGSTWLSSASTSMGSVGSDDFSNLDASSRSISMSATSMSMSGMGVGMGMGMGGGDNASVWSDGRSPSRLPRSRLNPTQSIVDPPKSPWTSRGNPHIDRSYSRSPTKRAPMSPATSVVFSPDRVGWNARRAVPNSAGGVRKVHVDFTGLGV